MDKKQTWLLMAVILGLTYLWLAVVLPWLAKKNNWDMTGGGAAANKSSPETQASASAPSTGPTTGPTSAPVIKGGIQAKPIVLGSTAFDPKGKGTYPLGVTLNNRGAGLDSATLNRFKQQYDKPTPYVFQQPYETGGPMAVALATRSVSINGAAPVSLDSAYWVPDESTDHSARFWIDIAGQLRITKTYEIHPANDKTAGYEVLVSYTLADLSGTGLKAKLAFNGTNSPKSENSRDYPEVVAGFDAGRQNVDVGHKMITGVTAEKPLEIKQLKSDEPLLWSGMTSASK
jgi:hypothetical protein